MTHHGWLVLLPAALLALGVLAAEPVAPLYPDRVNLLVLKDPEGHATPITKKAQWEQRRQHILLNMQKVMGPLPGSEKRAPLDVRLEKEERTPRFLRRKISYQSSPGERVPAYLLVPLERKGKAPAVLCLHQTVQIGKDEPVGLGGSANLHYAQELAERGYVVLAPDYPTLGEYQFDAYAHGYASASMRAIWDNMRGIDYLQSLPEVDGQRIGCIGHSLGGHNTLFTSAFDRRIRALVSNCGFTAFGKYYGGKILPWAGERYMPRIREKYPTPEQMPFDFQEVIAALAPRAFLASAPTRDANFEVSGVRDVMAAAAPVYALLGHPERLAAQYPDSEHDWPPTAREAAYKWLDRWLRE